MPRVFVLCPDWPEPSGGVKKLYRHVEVLSSHGIDASIVHEKQGFQPAWFRSFAPIRYSEQIAPNASDFILVPELAAWQVMRMDKWRGVPKLVFNQGAYQTFKGVAFQPGQTESPYGHPEWLGAIVVSEDSKRYLEHAFPGLRVFRIHNSIDPTLFFPAATKRTQISYMPRRNAKDALQVINIIKFRRALGGFDLAAIDNLPEVEAARVLRESVLFLSFGTAEGSPLPPAEAMACGCLVVGYDGRGGREFITPEYAYPIETGDVISFSMTVEFLIRQVQENPQPLREKARRASQFIRSTYALEREAADILEAWRVLAGLTPPSGFRPPNSSPTSSPS